jgi:hypothetical protein
LKFAATGRKGLYRAGILAQNIGGPHLFGNVVCARGFGETFFVTISFSELADI